MSPITARSRERLHTALASAFPTRGSLERMLRFELDVKLNDISAEADNLSSSVFRVIEWAEAHGRMDKLLAGARAANRDSPALNSLRIDMTVPRHTFVAVPATTSSTDATPAANPYDVYLLAGDRPFIDRLTLRRHLRTLAEGVAQILIVSGPLKSGRSYSWELIYHVSTALGVRAAYINVEEEAGAAMLDPDTVARRLAMEVGLADDLPLDLGSNRPRVLAQWLVAAFVNSGERWWIVLDGFEHPDVPSATHDLLGLLMETAQSPDLRGRLVSILLAYDTRMVPTRLLPHVLVEQLTPLSHSDVASFFERYLRGLGKTNDHALITELSIRAMKETQQNGLAGLNHAVIAFVRALRDQQ